jgi:hypothetical protein
MADMVRITGPGGDAVTVEQGQRYYKSGGKANIRADSDTTLFYENRRGEERPVTAGFFVRHYRVLGFNSPYSFGS